MAVVEQRPGLDRELVAALVALELVPSPDMRDRRELAAARALWPVRPAQFLKVGAALVLATEAFDQVDEVRRLHQEMPRRKPKAHEMTNDEIARKMFPKKAREAVRAEALKAPKTRGKMETDSTTKK